MSEVQHWVAKEKFEEKPWKVTQYHVVHSNFIEIRRKRFTTITCTCCEYQAQMPLRQIQLSRDGNKWPPIFLRSILGFSSKVWEFNHRIIRPWNTKANRKVEAAVKVAKQLLRKTQGNTDAYMALLDQMNTPKQGMATSPAKRFMSRRTKTLLLTKEALLCLEVPNADEQQHKLQRGQETCTSTLL